MILRILSIPNIDKRTALALILINATVLFSLICHEVAHGFTAYKLGDPTAKQEGRLSLSPLSHLDPLGTLMLLIVGFGYAKPVPVNVRRLRKPKRDMALVALAGPMTNLLLALVFGLLYCLCDVLFFEAMITETIQIWQEVLLYTFETCMSVNLSLMLFNLIPLPPLDGSNILVSLLPPHAAAKYLKVRYYTRYIFLGIIALSLLSSYSTLFSTLYSVLWLPFDLLHGLLETLITSLGFWLFGFLL